MGLITTLLDPILFPLLLLPPLWIIIVMSLGISLIITVAYKFFTNQPLMKILKDDLTKSRKKMKQYRQDPDKMLKIQKEAMDKQMQYMMHSLRPTLITFIPIILLFGWLSAHLAFVPVMPGETFEVSATFVDGVQGDVRLVSFPDNILISEAQQTIVNSSATWQLSGPEGEYTLSYVYEDEYVNQSVIITDEQTHGDVELKPDSEVFELVATNQEKLVLFNLFGWGVTWFWGYIIFSIVFSITIRKLFRVH